VAGAKVAPVSYPCDPARLLKVFQVLPIYPLTPTRFDELELLGFVQVGAVPQFSLKLIFGRLNRLDQADRLYD
jgi:hypothetical protein